MSFTSKLGQAVLPALVLASIAVPALAHPGHADAAPTASGFVTGFAHPFGGLDHLLAMLAVGIWAVQQSVRQPRALWLLPASFVLAMTAGFGFGLGGIALPGVETGIALSVLLLGLVVAFALSLPLVAATAVTVLFALFHGHAHAAEIGDASQMLTYAAGMLLATALLHGAGLAAARLALRLNLGMATRAAGAAVALVGLVILVG